MLSDQTLRFLLDNKFETKVYEDQKLTFYTMEICDEESLKKLIRYYYNVQDDEVISTDGISFVMEIQTNGESPQWTFTGGCEEFDLLENELEFVNYVRKVQEIIA